MKRRSFLRVVAASAAASGFPLVFSCGDGGDSTPTELVFPQGLASGDPKPTSIVLWTRAAPLTAGSQKVFYEVATDEGFDNMIASGELEAIADWDHTLRIKVTELEPGTPYFYRFASQGAVSEVGRAKTAPVPEDSVNVRFAFATCQDYVNRYFHSWRVLCEQEAEIDFVLFLGDYIYEQESGSDVLFRKGTGERAVELPDGLALDGMGAGVLTASSTADYRHLYKVYRSDPDLREAHRLFPFISVWDDHEFANDCWQDHAVDFNDTRGDEKSTKRREAATRAWFEYTPIDVEYDPNAGFPRDIRIFRSLRYGKHVDMVLTDQRYYRSDHVIPEGPIDLSVGKFVPNSPLGSRTFALKSGFDVKEAAAGVTMLGTQQRDWLVQALRESTATWTVWVSQLMLAQMLTDLSGFEVLPENLRDVFYFKLDQWDGFRTERAAVLADLGDVPNLVALSGDIHAFYASELYTDFDAPGAIPTAVEFTTASISALPVKPQVELLVQSNPLLDSLGLGEVAAMFDEVLRASNPHIRYAKSDTHGVSLCEISETEMQVRFFEVDDVQSPDMASPPREIGFRVASGSKVIERI